MKGDGWDLESLFTALPPVRRVASGARGFSAAPIGRSQHRVARDAEDHACILLTASSPAKSAAPPIRLANLSVQHDVLCALARDSGKPEKRRFTVVRYEGTDEQIKSYFLRAMAPVVAGLGESPSVSEVRRAINAFIELFRALDQTPSGTVQGLWAELFIISRASDPKALAAAWHAESSDRYDFNAGDQRIEVKSASGVRNHQFSLEQLTAPLSTRIIIASVMVERSGGGTSLKELFDEVREQLALLPELQMNVDRVVFATLGSSISEAMSERFDRHRAESTLRFLDSSAVPCVSRQLPPQVSRVQFTAEVEGVTPIPTAALSTLGGLFSAL